MLATDFFLLTAFFFTKFSYLKLYSVLINSKLGGGQLYLRFFCSSDICLRKKLLNTTPAFLSSFPHLFLKMVVVPLVGGYRFSLLFLISSCPKDADGVTYTNNPSSYCSHTFVFVIFHNEVISLISLLCQTLLCLAHHVSSPVGETFYYCLSAVAIDKETLTVLFRSVLILKIMRKLSRCPLISEIFMNKTVFFLIVFHFM